MGFCQQPVADVKFRMEGAVADVGIHVALVQAGWAGAAQAVLVWHKLHPMSQIIPSAFCDYHSAFEATLQASSTF